MFDSTNLTLDGLPQLALKSIRKLVSRPECSSDCLIGAFLGSKRIRYGCLPSPANHSYLCALLDRYQAINTPIECTLLWGALKGYGLYDDRLGADITDVLAFRRLQQIDAEVRRFHKPGIRVRIFMEDVTERILSHEFPDIDQRMAGYIHSIQSLAAASEMDIEVINESDVFGMFNVPLSDVIVRCLQNGALIHTYWKESQNHPNPEALPSYKHLQELGWNGILPQVQRDHYISRASSEKPHFTPDEQIRSICTYFGNALARYQYRLMGGRYCDRHGELPPVKISFAPYPNCVGDSMRRGRVEYKTKDSKNGNAAYTPWATFGFLSCSTCQQEVDFAGYGVGCFRDTAFKPRTSWIYANNFRFRADQLVAV